MHVHVVYGMRSDACFLCAHAVARQGGIIMDDAL
jgi:hypothetical protein